MLGALQPCCVDQAAQSQDGNNANSTDSQLDRPGFQSWLHPFLDQATWEHQFPPLENRDANTVGPWHP